MGKKEGKKSHGDTILSSRHVLGGCVSGGGWVGRVGEGGTDRTEKSIGLQGADQQN